MTEDHLQIVSHRMAEDCTTSLQIPPDVAPGDVLSFLVDKTELQLTVPEGASTGQVLEIQVGRSLQQEEEDEAVMCVTLHDDNKVLVLYHNRPKNDNDDNNTKEVNRMHAMVWLHGPRVLS